MHAACMCETGSPKNSPFFLLGMERSLYPSFSEYYK